MGSTIGSTFRTSIPYEVTPDGPLPNATEYKSHKVRGSMPAFISSIDTSGSNVEMRYREICSQKRKIECRLLFSKYTVYEADERCLEIHGTTFDGRYVSGRHIVYWSKI